MKNLRLKILLVLCLCSIGLVMYSWIQNSYQIDLFITKNQHYYNRIIQGIKESNDIDSVKIQAIQIIEGIDNNKFNKSKRAIRASKAQAVVMFMILIIIALTIIEIKRKTPHNKS
ncbi:hypothetical protein GCQ56_19755 [Marinifilum sp. N1E240]|uniref:hypothetical protein n=1 Tax=Marinifilum sp. N1E240 TaxID=2608082 RepID=UPI00128BE4BE|nr:hypothetical protein [Marinifilum sp. N1E240]MPQ49242.1 hypothetical protein [Marinifilum sp. N1E240]